VGSFYGDEVRFLPIDWMSAVDIDEPADWQLAEALFEYRRRNCEAVVPASRGAPTMIKSRSTATTEQT
jgi:hypothetical protein